MIIMKLVYYHRLVSGPNKRRSVIMRVRLEAVEDAVHYNIIDFNGVSATAVTLRKAGTGGDVRVPGNDRRPGKVCSRIITM